MRVLIKLFLLILAINTITGCKGQASTPDKKLPTAIKRSGPMNIGKLKNYQACKNDSDCIYVNNGCCDCANGGIEVAINKQWVGVFNKSLNCNKFTVCTMRARLKACGSGAVTCKNTLCSYKL